MHRYIESAPPLINPFAGTLLADLFLSLLGKGRRVLDSLLSLLLGELLLPRFERRAVLDWLELPFISDQASFHLST